MTAIGSPCAVFILARRPRWAPLLRRFEELVVENSKLGHSLDLTRKQLDMVMDRTIKAEAELEKAHLSLKALAETVEVLKRENASLVTQLAASKKP